MDLCSSKNRNVRTSSARALYFERRRSDASDRYNTFQPHSPGFSLIYGADEHCKAHQSEAIVRRIEALEGRVLGK